TPVTSDRITRDYILPSNPSLLCRSPSLFPATSVLFFFTYPSTSEPHTPSLHDALPICSSAFSRLSLRISARASVGTPDFLPKSRSEEHTSELQSRFDLVCRLLLEKKKNLCRHRYAWRYDTVRASRRGLLRRPSAKPPTG